ncbi:hypothetical protein [Fusobacterium necrophorum]|uniref:Uncharacterized protein n=1 Tax=Fusobacterium necrophorum subsp. funduliforme TaxID=143387 RepID=A0A162J8I2_9FUSO|nr:hypothetical protein [Fusobacterium necrophorum]AVQ21497.1 hypothetical protein C4N15_07475 [Fusobacterium necrophorum subsp. funduliforme]EHO19588.1 hypothetical protein HMPREF9466_01519 [Fusobacterium necrophorum subsp. funduliforme 1_1_36S]KYL05334.1 hypothetical protein A2J07_00940 [Fusobacterium necrophorum subsp. funduliforme]
MALDMNAFHNYKNKSKSFDTFNGTETQLYIKVPTEYDEFDRVTKFELVRLGSTSAFQYAEQYTAEPTMAIGEAGATAIACGSSIIQGSLMFEVLNKGFVNEVKDILNKAGIKQISLSFDYGGRKQQAKYSLEDIESVNDFPKFDIVMIAVKENNPQKKIQKQLIGCRFSSGGSGIGVNQISVREQYSFLAMQMEDFKPMENTTETPVGELEYDAWGEF